MSESNVYGSAAGFIQKFGDKPAIEIGEAAGKTIRRFTIRAFGSQALISVTVWPDHEAVAINEGDLVFCDGKVTTNVSQKADGSSVTYINLSASALKVVPQEAKAARQVVNQGGVAQAAPATTERAMF